MPSGVTMTRFSIEPSSATSTASALSGSSRTNSMCLSRTSVLLVSTTPAPRVRSDRRLVVSASAPSKPPALGGGAHLAVDPRALLAPEVAELQQRVDEEPQAQLGRQTSGARVRRVDQPELLEILHHIADRGGRQRDRQHAREMPGADGFAGRQIRFDDAAEDFARRGRSGSPGRRLRRGGRRGRPWREEWPGTRRKTQGDAGRRRRFACD